MIWLILYQNYLDSSEYFDQNSWLKMAYFFVPKYAQCSETYEINNFLIFANFSFEKWSIFYSNFLENLPKCHHKWSNYLVLLRFCSWLDKNTFQNILRKLKKVSLKNKCRNFFLVKIIWNLCKKKKKLTKK